MISTIVTSYETVSIMNNEGWKWNAKPSSAGSFVTWVMDITHRLESFWDETE
jgi:hypothetical protein